MIADFWRQIVKQVFSNLLMKAIVDPLFQRSIKALFSSFQNFYRQVISYQFTGNGLFAAGQNVINW